MNIGEALLSIKAKRSELVRLQEMRANSFKRRIDGNTVILPPENESFPTVTLEISKLTTEIRGLKVKVENTNHNHKIDTPEGRMTIAEAIHYVADMRSELASLQTLKDEYKPKDRWGDETAVQYSYQINQRSLLHMINELESKKVRMDAFLSARNWEIELDE